MRSRWPIGVGLVAFVLVTFGRQLAHAIPSVISRMDSLGPWAPVLFILGYAVAAVVLIPGSFITLAAGAVFGVWRGTLLVLVGATLGASAAFLISRYVARDLVARRLAGRTTIAAIDVALESDGLWITFLLRLSPLVPFGLLNYALGLTRVKFRDFLLASVGMIPGTLLYTYSGYLAGDLAAVAARGTPVHGPWHTALLVIGLIATLAVTILVTRKAREALAVATARPTS